MTVLFERMDSPVPVVATATANHQQARELVKGLNRMPHIRLAWVSYSQGSALVTSTSNL